jgi:hypothetical protein
VLYIDHMMTDLEIAAERGLRRMTQGEFGRFLASEMKSPRAYTPSEVSHWETGRRPVPAAVEAALLRRRWGLMGLQRIYVISGDDGPVKIGRSMLPWARCTQLRSDTKRDLRVAFELFAVDAPTAEKLAHAKLARFRREGEWFDVTPLEAIAAAAAAVEEVNSCTVAVYLSDEERAAIQSEARPGESVGQTIKRLALSSVCPA